jgi:hypothetical protein
VEIVRPQLEEALHNVVMNQNGRWQIKCSSPCDRLSKQSTGALRCYQLAEKDGECGHAPEVLVQHEKRSLRYGPDETAVPAVTAIPVETWAAKFALGLKRR